MSSPSPLNLAELCARFSALGEARQKLIRDGPLSPTTDTSTVAALNAESDFDASNNVGDPDFYDVNYVPLPGVAPVDDGEVSGISEFNTSFLRQPRVVNGKNVESCGVSMMECLQGVSEMIDGETRLHDGWGENSEGMINVLIAWPGYNAHSIAEICVYENTDAGKQRITRLELAKKIAMHYFLFFDCLTLNEHNAENGEAHHEDGIGQDPFWKVGLRGYMFDRLHIMSISQTFSNFCQVEISVMTAKGFPNEAMYP